ncbi:transposase (fragment) [Syntrophaceticus schinkii]|uniref:Transposase n=1 Tax=Syntrophaceticus schinkii TaxID=499207 RepID=A0A0B7MRC6_9FIRM
MERDEATLYIRQQCLISFEDALKMQPETRLEKIFSTLDLKPIISRLPRKHNGPRGYNAKYKLRALIAAKIEQIPTMAALVRRLKNDPVFRYICGFGVIASVPSEATMSRFLRELTETGILKELFNSFVNKAEQMGGY